MPIAGFWITDRRLDLVQRKAKRRVYIAVSPKGFSQVVAIMPPNGRAMVMTLLLMEKSVAVLPERSKLFESHWSNQWLTSKIELHNQEEVSATIDYEGWWWMEERDFDARVVHVLVSRLLDEVRGRTSSPSGSPDGPSAA